MAAMGGGSGLYFMRGQERVAGVARSNLMTAPQMTPQPYAQPAPRAPYTGPYAGLDGTAVAFDETAAPAPSVTTGVVATGVLNPAALATFQQR